MSGCVTQGVCVAGRGHAYENCDSFSGISAHVPAALHTADLVGVRADEYRRSDEDLLEPVFAENGLLKVHGRRFIVRGAARTEEHLNKDVSVFAQAADMGAVRTALPISRPARPRTLPILALARPSCVVVDPSAIVRIT